MGKTPAMTIALAYQLYSHENQTKDIKCKYKYVVEYIVGINI